MQLSILVLILEVGGFQFLRILNITEVKYRGIITTTKVKCYKLMKNTKGFMSWKDKKLCKSRELRDMEAAL